MKRTILIVATCWVVATSATLEAETKMRASDAGQWDAFGEEAASDGSHLIVGASQAPPRGGAAYVYSWDGTGWGNEVQLRGHDQTKRDFFGSDVDIDGDRAIVGARWHDPLDRGLQNNKYGAAYFFQRSETGWDQVSFVQASDRQLNHEFGGAVAISGDHAVVGAIFTEVEGRANQGQVYVFSHKDGQWTESQILVAADGKASDHFGESVDIDGDYIFVGGVHHPGGAYGHSIGAVWVFKRGAGNEWRLETKLAPSDLEDGNAFGSSVEISGDVAIVGAQLAHGAETGTGTAYIFRRDATGWTQEARLTAERGRLGDDFGHRVAIDGDRALVGAWLAQVGDEGLQQGRAYVFDKAASGWTQRAMMTAGDGGYEDQFGSSVALAGDSLIVGASGDGAEGTERSGSLYVYDVPPR